MRATGFIACLLAAWNCAEKAVGVQPQTLFAPGLEWVWWFAVLMWGAAMLRFLVNAN